MKIIFTLALTILMSVGVFANRNPKNINPELQNTISKTLVIENKTVKPVLESNAQMTIDITIHCSDGSTYRFYCDDNCDIKFIENVLELAYAICS